MEEKDKNAINRREFIEAGVKSAVTAGAILSGCAGTGLLSSCSTSTTAPATSSSTTVTTDSSNIATLDTNTLTTLQSVNGSVLVRVNAVSGTRNVIVTRSSSTQVVAVNALCPHAGCNVGTFSGSSYLCPCHGSTFSLSGGVTQGPASSNLTTYTAALSGTNIFVTVP